LRQKKIPITRFIVLLVGTFFVKVFVKVD